MSNIHYKKALTGLIILILTATISALIKAFVATKNLMGSRTVFTTVSCSEPVCVYENNFESLKKYLGTTKTVGYVDDTDRNNSDVETFSRKFLVAQYILAPVIVHDSIDYPDIIVFVTDLKKAKEKLKGKKIKLIKDFGNGVYLFKKD